MDICEPIHMADSRIMHIRGVAEQAYRLAKGAGLSDWQAEDMYLLGFVHDIGYALGDGRDHANAGADALGRHGYDLSDAVRLHGEVVEEPTVELIILDVADITVDAYGRLVTTDERLADIRSRHGDDSEVTRKCERMVGWLRESVPGIVSFAEAVVRQGRDEGNFPATQSHC